MSMTSRTQESRRQATRGALVAAARRLFVARGYANTGTPELVAEAEVTRGALYHHFKDKADLLAAVATDMAQEVAAAVAAAALPGMAPLPALRAGSRAYFAAMAEGGRARVLLLDAPAVLSPGELQRLSDLAGADELRLGLEACLGRSKKLPLHELSSLLSAAFDRAARAVATGEDAARWTRAMDFMLAASVAEMSR